MQTSIDTRFFRAGVGTVIYNQRGEVALFERTQNPIGMWQFQQGGIDLGEHPTDTLWRELKEEIGLEQNHFDSVIEYPSWTIHQYDHTATDANKSRLGQAHRWFFLALKDGVKIDLSQATELETSNYQWLSFPEVVKQTEHCKIPVYRALETFFNSTILGQNPS